MCTCILHTSKKNYEHLTDLNVSSASFFRCLLYSIFSHSNCSMSNFDFFREIAFFSTKQIDGIKKICSDKKPIIIFDIFSDQIQVTECGFHNNSRKFRIYC